MLAESGIYKLSCALNSISQHIYLATMFSISVLYTFRAFNGPYNIRKVRSFICSNETQKTQCVQVQMKVQAAMQHPTATGKRTGINNQYGAATLYNTKWYQKDIGLSSTDAEYVALLEVWKKMT